MFFFTEDHCEWTLDKVKDLTAVDEEEETVGSPLFYFYYNFNCGFSTRRPTPSILWLLPKCKAEAGKKMAEQRLLRGGSAGKQKGSGSYMIGWSVNRKSFYLHHPV